MFLIVISIISRCGIFIFFCTQKTAYELRISDWSADVCSSDLLLFQEAPHIKDGAIFGFYMLWITQPSTPAHPFPISLGALLINFIFLCQLHFLHVILIRAWPCQRSQRSAPD